ncbi:NUDIX hydrolase [Luteibaculum oceani]|uniref:CoA pyrophosphatase n=1 Tax=Luteibaculum oceani TaxID=1294296 RepID=A0A5C6VB52_9FLAO|nr:CoA pyrophosphatase [Luteibaculum oceani]TXC82170.1 CoA pyrophosphatase [Luteibaculum oceani]
MKELQELKSFLLSQIQSGLPGEKAHMEMASYKRPSADAVKRKRLGARASAVMVGMYYKSGLLHCSLIQRPDYDGTHSGQVAFPGGKKEQEDPDLEFTALRETEEEVGIEPSKIEVIGRMSDLYIPPSNFLVTPVMGVLNAAPSFKIDEQEVAEAFHFPLRLLYDEDSFVTERIYLPYYKAYINAPSINFQGKIIWGATAMMLSELKSILNTDFLEI